LPVNPKEINIMIRFKVVLAGVAMALAVASVVLAVLKAASVQTTVILLGTGLFAISLANFERGKIDKKLFWQMKRK
jgi:hypothetical protein